MVLMMMMTMVLANMAKSELHYVGGDKSSWGPNVNLTEWSSHEHFHLEDWLYFGYDRNEYNVLEVNKTGYENCVDTGFVQNISRGAGRDVFHLTEFKTYYFLSGGGYCWHGMKVAISVTEGVSAPNPATSPKGGAQASSPKSGCASDGIQVNQKLLEFIFVLMWSISSINISY
ncbi:Lamin-like protein [Glycine max]|uniref:Lamin-like protein n=1 Tax=Glycine soja TaxID=3848 RepID=A0A445LUW6_GLYSO|nr:lamin-like protein [Glycine max]XP_028185261.1 lamin-like protein [Glycine soja]KAH1263518.1 Lamin-like protein [Glycine max]KHN38431.1 Lamin-like protein [Glycine soja]RZC27021.1 Lamin-like protein [Glycine soja]|eukprot:XP_006576116.1 lamin-like protein [Glycine max]